MTYTRFDAVEEAFMRPPVEAVPPASATSEYFGCNVFNRKNMRKYLSADTRQKVYKSIEQGITLQRDVAEPVAAGASVAQALLEETKETYKKCQKVCFDGNGYSDEWKAEAKKRGLDCETSAPLCYDAYVSKQSLNVYEATGVMSHIEMKARTEICWEIYSKKIEIEARVLADLTANHILPVATRYQSVLLDNVSKMKEIFTVKKEFDQVAESEIHIIKDIAMHCSEARTMAEKMEEECDALDRIEDERTKAIGYHDRITVYLEEIRQHVDALEMIVDDEMWPLPKYRELLFIR